MTENNTKLTKPQLIIGAVVLVVILFFVFSNKPVTEQAKNLSESFDSAGQFQENTNYGDQLVKQLMGRDRDLPYEIIPYFRSMVDDFFDQIIKKGYLINTGFNKSEKKLTLYLDSSILEDDMVETWITGLAVQVMGEIKNSDDFILKYSMNENTDEYSFFAVYGVPSGVIDQIPKKLTELIPKAIETTVDNGTGRARILDLVVQGRIFAHFENGEVFPELDRLGLLGVMSRDGEAIFFQPNLQK